MQLTRRPSLRFVGAGLGSLHFDWVPIPLRIADVLRRCVKALVESGRAGGTVDIQILEFDCLLRDKCTGYTEYAHEAHPGGCASGENRASSLGIRVHGCLLQKVRNVI